MIGEAREKLARFFLKKEKEQSLGETREISDPDFKKIEGLFFDEYPEILEHVIIDIGDPEVDTALKSHPVIFGPEDKRGYQPRISLSARMEDENDLWNWMRKERIEKVNRLSDILKQRLGDKFTELNPKILKIVMFLHELEHAKKYLEKYKGLSYEKAFKQNRLDYQRRYDSLPVPGVLGQAAKQYWQKSQGDNTVDKVKDMIRKIKLNYFSDTGHGKGMKFNEELFKANLYQYGVFGDESKMDIMLSDHQQKQEGFKNEKEADDFSVEFLKDHWEELGLDKE
ncbi:MAG TPA: hypothetical protein DEB09_03560 [Candidatus Magasanikbacteria bacterium]|nr:hypothetical protein [Candidatus Magasanikbacteria bacterium]